MKRSAIRGITTYAKIRSGVPHKLIIGKNGHAEIVPHDDVVKPDRTRNPGKTLSVLKKLNGRLFHG